MDNYTIKKAHHWTKDKDIEIKSENLIYTECENMNGCQCIGNESLIIDKCAKVAELIREIDELNK